MKNQIDIFTPLKFKTDCSVLDDHEIKGNILCKIKWVDRDFLLKENIHPRLKKCGLNVALRKMGVKIHYKT